MPAASSPPSRADPRGPGEIALAIARQYHAPPPLGELDGCTMLAVAAVPGKLPEEWQPEGAWPFWMAWPHAAGAGCAEEMTAAQLRAILAARDGHG